MEEKDKDKIAGAFYQVHSFAKLIGDDYSRLTAPNYDGQGSDPLLSFVNLVQEKAEFCLKVLDETEVSA